MSTLLNYDIIMPGNLNTQVAEQIINQTAGSARKEHFALDNQH